VRVLFIGNSFTARNDLPALIAEQMAASGGRLEHQLIWAGGAPLRRHWNAGDARHAIESARWDYVVLQEQSTLPLKNPERMYESVALFDALIRDAGARTALYMTWARAHAPESQEVIADVYLNVGYALDALVVPVGLEWQRALGSAAAPTLYDRDGSHPSLDGSRLAARVFAETLRGGGGLTV